MSPQKTRAEFGEASPRASTGPAQNLRLEEFNALEREAALEVLRPCLDVERWLTEVVDGRPYASLSDLETAARKAADPLTAEEVEGALAHHPRIGDRAAGRSSEELVTALQGRLGNDPETEDRIVADQLREIALLRLAGLVIE